LLLLLAPLPQPRQAASVHRLARSQRGDARPSVGVSLGDVGGLEALRSPFLLDVLRPERLAAELPVPEYLPRRKQAAAVLNAPRGSDAVSLRRLFHGAPVPRDGCSAGRTSRVRDRRAAIRPGCRSILLGGRAVRRIRFS